MRLKATGDQTHASVGDDMYPVDDFGFIDVPPEHAPELKSHGFRELTKEEFEAQGGGFEASGNGKKSKK